MLKADLRFFPGSCTCDAAGFSYIGGGSWHIKVTCAVTTIIVGINGSPFVKFIML